MTKLHEQLVHLDRLHNLIRLKATGTPRMLAKKMEVSRRTVFNLIKILRNFGAEIAYCRERETYYYETDIKFRFEIVIADEKKDKKNDFFGTFFQNKEKN